MIGKQFVIGAVCLVAFTSAVILKRDPFVRLIPADVLRGKTSTIFGYFNFRI
jgi:hypothetical protein